MNHKSIYTTALMAILVLAQACGASDFASQLRLILSASGPLIASLNLGDKKAAVIADFSDLAQGAATLSDDLKACAADKPCKLDAAGKFQIRFFDIERRGHFKLSPKLQNVESILQGIIEAAKVYYGAKQPRTATAGGPVPSVNPANELKAKLDELKEALKP